MNDIVDIKTGRAISEPPKKIRQKTGQDAKRWKLLFEWLTSGAAILTIGGGEVSRDDISGLSGTLDIIIEEDAVKLKRLYSQKRRDDAKK